MVLGGFKRKDHNHQAFPAAHRDTTCAGGQPTSGAKPQTQQPAKAGQSTFNLRTLVFIYLFYH